MVKRDAWQTLLLAAFFGAAIWALTPLLTGQREPWDVAGLFYYAALFLTGIVAGLLRPEFLWAHYLGAIVGQLIYELIFLRVGPLVLIGAALLLVFCLVYLLGACIGSYFRILVTRQPGNDRVGSDNPKSKIKNPK